MSVETTRSVWHRTKIGLLALLSMIGFDLFLHAGVLAPVYVSPSAFLLSPEEAFRRIPLGYASFAVTVAFFVWIAERLDLKNWRKGLLFGLIFGVVIWGSLTLGLYSISTASPALLLGWFLGQTAELGVAGIVVGAGLSARRLRSLLIRVVVFFFVMVVLAVVLQNIWNFD